MIIKMIGNKWVKNQKAVVQVVHFCSEIGLIDDGLMTENIITSVGIQRRYYEIAVKRMKRQLYSDKYWLLEKEENNEGLLNAPKNRINSEENQNDSESKSITSEISDTKIKEKKNKIYISTAPPTQNRFFSDDKLGIGTKFAAWFPRICEYGFEENVDWKRVSQKCPTLGGAQEMVDYQISVDIAKQICMIQGFE